MTHLQITPGFWLLLAAVWALDPKLLLPALSAAAIHELGHLFVLWLVGSKCSQLRLTFLGAQMTSAVPLSYRQELPVVLAGPLCSLLAGYIGARSSHFLFAGLSLSLGVFNLLPIHPLDGGRALRCLCALVLPAPWDRETPRYIGVVTAGLALGLALPTAPQLGGPTLLAPVLWLSFQALNSQNS